MSTIDITPAVDAAARRLWIEHAPQHYAGLVKGPHWLDRADAREQAGDDWDNGHVSLSVQNTYREKVLPIVYAAHRYIAQQAWDEGAHAAWERSTSRVNGEFHHWRHEGEPVNPYAPVDAPDEG